MSLELVIVRHAIAFEGDARRRPDDGERLLSPRGVTRARKAAVGLKRLVPGPVRMLTSPLVRARQTAAILTEVAGWPPAAECAELAPGAAPGALFAALRRMPQTRIAIVGHEPGLSRLIAASLPGNAAAEGFRLRKMAVAQLTFAGNARLGGARLDWLVPARLLRAAR